MVEVHRGLGLDAVSLHHHPVFGDLLGGLAGRDHRTSNFQARDSGESHEQIDENSLQHPHKRLKVDESRSRWL